MEWLTPKLFIFEAELPDGNGLVEVKAEIWGRMGGELDHRGAPLEPDEVSEVLIHEVRILSPGGQERSWIRHEAWLLKEAEWQVMQLPF